MFKVKWQLLNQSNIADIRLTSWGEFFTPQGGAKRPSNVEVTCNQNMSFPTFFPTNVKKKGRYLYLFQEILGNLYDRTRVEVIGTPSIRHVGGQNMGRLGWPHRFFAKKKTTGTL